MSIGSLFSGIGGLELGLEWAGLGPVAWQVEVDPFCRSVLAQHWPHADRSIVDVRNAGAQNLSPVSIVCGGFPCQDVSSAGRRVGLDGTRSGLWWEFHRIVDELKPEVVVVENVASGASRWLPAVRRSLCGLGYRTRALGIGACDVGAPHLRRRIFILAYADCEHLREQSGRSSRPYRQEALELGSLGRREAEPGLGRAAHGLSAELDPARHQWPVGPGRPQESWETPRQAFSVKNRTARLRALGNAVVPQCAYIVGLLIRNDMAAGTLAKEAV